MSLSKWLKMLSLSLTSSSFDRRKGLLRTAKPGWKMERFPFWPASTDPPPEFFYQFLQAKFDIGGLILSLSQFLSECLKLY